MGGQKKIIGKCLLCFNTSSGSLLNTDINLVIICIWLHSQKLWSCFKIAKSVLVSYSSIWMVLTLLSWLVGLLTGWFVGWLVLVCWLAVALLAGCWLIGLLVDWWLVWLGFESKLGCQASLILFDFCFSCQLLELWVYTVKAAFGFDFQINENSRLTCETKHLAGTSPFKILPK